MRKLLKILLLIELIGLGGFRGLAQGYLSANSSPAQWGALNTLSSAISGLNSLSSEARSYYGEEGSVTDLIHAMKSANDGLIVLAHLNHNGELDKDEVVYNQSLLNLAAALEQVAKDQSQSIEAKYKICAAAMRDLELKQEVATATESPYTPYHLRPRQHKGVEPSARPPGPWPASPLGTVLVVVTTTTGEKKSEGCEVWAVPEIWSDVAGHDERFPTLNSPTFRPLAPGFYKMWAVREGRKGESSLVPVAGDPRSVMVVELSAPE